MRPSGPTSLLLITALLLAPLRGGAYETDQFTNRLSPIEDAMPALDKRVNQSITDAIGKHSGPRNERTIVNAIYNDIGGRHWVDKIERWAMKSGEIERLQPSRYESIYRGHPIWATRVAALFGVGPTIKINGVLVGSDKLGHFLSQGRKFWKRWEKMQDEAQAAEHSAYTERALFGQATTGVYSNADLVANYEGYRFYRSLFEDDVIPGKPAILSWNTDHWVVQRPFTWADHVNEYWDEALNINHFDSLLYPHMQQRLMQFCPDYFEAPHAFAIEDEARLQALYSHIQLRDTSELRLDRLCRDSSAGNYGLTAGSAEAQ